MAHDDGKRGARARDAGPVPDGAGFLDRWSKRKSQARNDGSVRASENRDEDAPPPEAAAPEPAPLLSDDDMPAIESLAPESDYSGFLSEGVSEKLRKLALRRLFHLADFNVRDGLDDYDEDFTGFEPLGDIVTADVRQQHDLPHDSAAPPNVEVTGTPADTPASMPARRAAESAAPCDAAPPEAQRGKVTRAAVAEAPEPGDDAALGASREDAT